MSNTVLSNVLTYGKGLLSSRVLGLVRDLLIGISLGVGAESDILLIILTIPDFIANVSFGAGAQLALLPFFQTFSKNTSLHKLFKVLKAFTVFAIPFSFILVYFKNSLILFFLPAYTLKNIFEVLSPLNLCLFLVVSSTMLLATPIRSYLQAHKKFKSLGLENVIFNVFIISGVLMHLWLKNNSILFLFIFASFIARILWLAKSVKSFTLLEGVLAIDENENKKAYSLPFLNIFNSSLFSIVLVSIPVVIRSFSTYLGEGWATKFIFANRLVDAALLIFTTIIGSVVFSELPSLLARSKKQLFKTFSLTSLFLMPTLSLAGFLCTFNLLAQVSTKSEIYDYLYVLLALSIFIPARLFIHYYNLILIAENKSLVSAVTAVLAALSSFLTYKNISLPVTDPYLFVLIQAVLLYPLCIGLLIHFTLSYKLRLDGLYAVIVHALTSCPLFQLAPFSLTGSFVFLFAAVSDSPLLVTWCA